MGPGKKISSLAPLAFERLPIGAITPQGWFRHQLILQLFGLSGHLQRFWPDIANSTWIYPENHWQETYSDRGGNLPYWLNGVIPLAFQLRKEADRVDSTGYNLTHVVVNYMHTVLVNQRANRYGNDGMDHNFNLGTWNVVRSCLLYMSARPSVVAEFAPFVVNYVRAAQRQLLSKGWTPDSLANTVCTEDDRYHPHGGDVAGQGSHCAVRYPDWMWVLQEIVDSRESLHLSAEDVAAVFEHMQTIAAWGADYSIAYSTPPCEPGSNRTGRPDCFPRSACNSGRLLPRPNCTVVPQAHGYFTHGVSGGAMPLKEGAVRWRMVRDSRFRKLSAAKLAALDAHHGQPTGMFSADEHFAGRTLPHAPQGPQVELTVGTHGC